MNLDFIWLMTKYLILFCFKHRYIYLFGDLKYWLFISESHSSVVVDKAKAAV
ncbi:hypothetical protein Hdeb2414_s0406g00887181 [Helianthus debilis subsp. tardiflorus]